MADNTKFVSLPPKQLTEPLSTSATTLYANNLDFDLDGTRPLAITDLGDYGWIVIEPRSSEKKEICKVTGVSGTQLTIVRGYKPFSPYDQDTATWAKTHSAGVSFVFTNAPQMYDEFAVKDNDETITGTWTFTEATRPLLTADSDTAVNEELVTFGQLYRTSLVGAVNADETHNGLVEIPTTAEVTSGASTGGTGAFVVPTPAQIAAQIQSNAWISGSTAGTADAITATLTPAISALTHNMMIVLHITTQNNAGCTLNVNGTGAKAVYKYAGGVAVAVEAGDMKALYHHIFLYDSDAGVFLLVNPANGALTATIMNLVNSFFASTLTQQLKTTLTAGQDLAASDLVASESDGKVYRTRPTSLPGTNRNSSASAGEQFGTSGRKEMYLTPTSTKVVWLGDDAQATKNHGAFVVTSDALYSAPSAGAWTDIASADATFSDSLLVSDMVISAYRLATGANILRATADIDGTPSNGAELTVVASGGDAMGISTTTAANTYVAISKNGTNLVGYKITASGSTLTNAASGTLLAGSTLNAVCAKQFTGTDYILVLCVEGTNLKAVVGEYNTSTGAWTSVGTPITVEELGDASRGYYLNVISSTKIFVGIQSSSSIEGSIITRSSGTTISATTPTPIITGATVPGMVSYSKIDNRHYLFGAETNAGGKLQIVELDRDYEVIAAVGSALTNSNVNDRGISGCILTPTRIVTIYQTSATDSAYAIEDIGTNLSGVIGFIDAATEQDATGGVITSGYVSGLSGLTPGEEYYMGLNGGITPSSAAVGITPLSSSTLIPSKVRLVFRAISSTTGIKI